MCSYRRLANLFPDWLFVPKAHRDLTRYIDDLIEKTLALPINNQADSKTEKEFNLVEDLVATHPNDRYFIRGQLMAVLMASKVRSVFNVLIRLSKSNGVKVRGTGGGYNYLSTSESPGT